MFHLDDAREREAYQYVQADGGFPPHVVFWNLGMYALCGNPVIHNLQSVMIQVQHPATDKSVSRIHASEVKTKERRAQSSSRGSSGWWHSI